MEIEGNSHRNILPVLFPEAGNARSRHAATPQSAVARKVLVSCTRDQRVYNATLDQNEIGMFNICTCMLGNECTRGVASV